ncbi:MAG: NlpC/P60 family protein [Gaiellaceae bacterium]
MIALVSAAPATAAPSLRAQQQRARVVHAQVSAINARLEGIVQAWDGARVQLGSVEGALHTNETRLRVARANLKAAQAQIEQRLVELYVSPSPDFVTVLAGATSLSDLIDRIEAVNVFTAQDSAIAQQAQGLQRQVSRRETLLQHQRQLRTQTLARLRKRQQTIARDLANERRLLATIHQNIHALQAQQASRERQRATRARARIAHRVRLARQQAAAAALAPTTSPILATPANPAATQTAPPPTTPPPAPAPALPPPTAPTPAPPPLPPLTPSPAPPTHTEAASIAAQYLGAPYLWGGASPAGFDCSGLVSYVYAQLGVSLPHYTVSQWNATVPIPTTDLQPGDLVFFDGLSHVGIYIGADQFIHAPHTGTVVQIATLTGYWATHLDGAHRVP